MFFSIMSKLLGISPIDIDIFDALHFAMSSELMQDIFRCCPGTSTKVAFFIEVSLMMIMWIFGKVL